MRNIALPMVEESPDLARESHRSTTESTTVSASPRTFVTNLFQRKEPGCSKLVEREQGGR